MPHCRRRWLPHWLPHWLPGWLTSWLPLAALIALITACGVMEERDGPGANITAEQVRHLQPRAEPRARYGNHSPYEVYGRQYTVMPSAEGYVQRGVASWYGSKFHGRRTSSGEPYDMYTMTAAHRSLPLPTWVQVTNLDNGRSAVVKVNDRGPFVDNRLLDLSYGAAVVLGVKDAGTARVEVRSISFVDGQPLVAGLQTAPVGTARRESAQRAQTPTPASRPAPTAAATATASDAASGAATRTAAVADAGPASDAGNATAPPPATATAPASRQVAAAAAASPPAPATTAAQIKTAAPAKSTAVVATHPTSRREPLRASRGSQRLFLQLGAFADRHNAFRLRGRLRDDTGIDGVHVSQTLRGDTRLYRVRMGPYASRGALADAVAALRRAGIDGYRVISE